MILNGFRLTLFNAYRWVFSVLVSLPWIGNWFDLFTLCVSTVILRSSVGSHAAKNLNKCKRPKKTLILYEFECCSYCRKVREVLSVLDLDCIIYPCPRTTFEADGVASEESRFRPEAVKIGGKAQFPLLVDQNVLNSDNEPLHMYESDDICNYLIQMYGDKCEMPWAYTLSRVFMMPRLFLGVLCRPLDQHGMRNIRRHSNKNELLSELKCPKKMLELFSSESSPFSKRVREALCSLEIPYLLRNAPFGSAKRKEFKERFYEGYISSVRKTLGFIQLPLLVDPNVDGGKVILESLDIVDYLKKQYGGN